METKTPAKPKQPGGGWKKRLAFAAVVSAALTFTLCLFGPLDLFFNNYEEIWFHFQDIIGGIAVVAGLFFLLTTLVGTLLRGKLHDLYMALMFGGLLGTYVQGSFMNKNYGLLNGNSVDWSAYTGYGVVNTLVWVVCILVPLIAMLIWKQKKVRPVFLFLSCALILMQGASLVVSFINYPTVTESATLTTEGLYDLSKENNTILFIVDTLDEQYYQEMLQRHPEYTKKLEGFTNYDNAMAGGSRTPVGLPLLLTGIPRLEQGTYAQYMDMVWSEQTVFSDLKAAGYDTRLFTESRFVGSTALDVLDNLEMSTTSVGDYTGLTKKMYKLTLYKYVPHFLKWRFWMTTNEFDKYKSGREYVVNDAKLYKKYQDNDGFTYTNQAKCFRLYHMLGAHKRFTLNADGTRNKKTTSQKTQIDGCFHIIFDMLDDLKENGVYDKSNIIIMSDHGDKGKAQGGTLLYKPAGSTGAYKTNSAPVSFLDIPATLASIAGGDVSDAGTGKTLDDIKEGETRTRTMYLHSGTNATNCTDEYQSTAHASDSDALKLVKQYTISDNSTIPAYQLGKPLSFTIDKATGNVYCTYGFRTVQTNTTCMEGYRSQLVIPIENPPESGDLTATLSYKDVITACHMTITVDGETVLEHDFARKDRNGKVTFTFPASALKDGKLTIDFTVPSLPESEEDKEPGHRTKTVRITGLVIDTVD